ncbi:hypothetical protein [Hymenobacter roseosalivarius]|nr:hypothetical protein [Hymenobacter roseosalivarius]
MTLTVFADLNAFLGEWDPIGMPKGLELDEYQMYVPGLLAAYNKGQTVERFLLWVYEQQIGFEVNEEFWAFTRPLAERITQYLRAHEE